MGRSVKKNAAALPQKLFHIGPAYKYGKPETNMKAKDNQFNPAANTCSESGGLGMWNLNANSDAISPGHQNESMKRVSGSRPPTHICYICGREYGTASITIHEKQCFKKWKQVNDQLPEAKRRPEPVKPSFAVPGMSTENEQPLLGTNEYDLSKVNDAAVASYQNQFSKCEKCGRTFLPDSLVRHSKGCRGFHNILQGKKKAPRTSIAQ